MFRRCVYLARQDTTNKLLLASPPLSLGLCTRPVSMSLSVLVMRVRLVLAYYIHTVRSYIKGYRGEYGVMWHVSFPFACVPCVTPCCGGALRFLTPSQKKELNRERKHTQKTLTWGEHTRAYEPYFRIIVLCLASRARALMLHAHPHPATHSARTHRLSSSSLSSKLVLELCAQRPAKGHQWVYLQSPPRPHGKHQRRATTRCARRASAGTPR